jgi:hypothetical protein
MLVQATQDGYMDNRIIKGPSREGQPGEIFSIPDSPVVDRVNPKTKQKEKVPQLFSFRWMRKVTKKDEKPVKVYTQEDVDKLVAKAKTEKDKETARALLGQPKV